MFSNNEDRKSEDKDNKEKENAGEQTSSAKVTMSTLAVWNISKALEENPNLDLKSALKATQERLGHEAVDTAAILKQRADERHLSCALLAWHQLGHENSESLHRFVKARLRADQSERATCSKQSTACDQNFITFQESDSIQGSVGSCYETNPPGPVLRLPVEPKIVMRLDNSRSSAQAQRVQKAGQDLREKIEQACCLESGCVERLALLDAQTKELRGRLAKLSRREAARVELLERAETAWRDLEMGYMRRLRAVTEKEDDLERHTKKLIAERNDYKETCSKLVQVLKPRGEAVEKSREGLKKMESEVCDQACERLQQSEVSAREDALLAEIQCKCAQQDRDLQFKEEAVRRKKQNLESEVESLRGLAYEAERAMRAELGGLKQQVKEVSKELLAEDAAITKVKAEIEEYQKEKCEIIEDLEGCQLICDKGMQKKIDELKKKRDQLQTLKDKILDCRCKVPVDVAVEVKRTPSLAALCQCTPEDKILESCSCTSLRSRLLSDLLSDLFGGLQTELGNAGTKMPCQLLKCLEDRHNWDRTSVVKSNLRNFFAKLLVGELDIAIATSIEKYHAKWVGASCADAARTIPDIGQTENEGWEQRAIEQRARKLALQLAEKMFQEKEDEIMDKAIDIVTKGPPPCECKPTQNTAVFPCFVPQRHTVKGDGASAVPTHIPPRTPRISVNSGVMSQVPWQRTINDVSRLRLQIEDLKRDSIKKEDLKVMERKIARLVQLASSPEPIQEINLPNKDIEPSNDATDANDKKGNISKKNLNFDQTFPAKKKVIKKKYVYNEPVDKTTGKNVKRQYAVNLCLCGSHRNSSKVPQREVQNDSGKEDSNKPRRKGASKEILSQMSSSIRHCKPITHVLSREDVNEDNKKVQKPQTCGSTCACFNKIPSCTSIDKFLQTLTKWEGDINFHPEVTKDMTTKKENTICGTKMLDSDLGKKLSQPKQTDLSLNDFSFSPNCSIFTKSKLCTVIGDSCQISNNENKNGKVIPNITVSEYMGAVNLERSNENFCKCVIDCKENNDDSEKNGTKHIYVPIQCINSNKCVNTNSLELKNKKIESKFKIEKETIEKTIDQNITKKPHTHAKGSKEDRPNNIIRTDISSEKSTGNVKKNTDKFSDSFNIYCEKTNRASDAQNLREYSVSCGCDYQIKFLGVTLAHSSSNKRLDSIPTDNNVLVYSPLQNMEKTSIDENIYPAKVHISEENPLLTSKPSVCQCNLKLNELKSTFENSLNKECGDATESKMLNTSITTIASPDKQDNCICCVESHDLEVNTFHLLEEHLKKRLLKLKNNCKSACFHPDEEIKLFQTIFKQIKHTVLETTDKVLMQSDLRCKCSEDASSNGSWHTAFTLLQEYLKTKIKRIQCTCSAPSESKAILPILTDKVCDLIERDFQRLKDICKCSNSVLGGQTLKKQQEFQMPERDKNCSTARKITPQLKDQNASAQILPETKSCEAMAKIDHLMNTIEIQKPDIDDLFFSIGSKHSVCLGRSDLIDIDKTKSLRNLATITDNNYLLRDVVGDIGYLPPEIKHFEDINEVLNIDPAEKKKPFIGYTIDCSCNSSLGKCVCSKSMVHEKISTIDKLWKNYTITQVGKEKSSYIMQSVYPFKHNNNLVKVTEHFYTDNIPKTTTLEHSSPKLCNVNTSLHCDEDIVLIDSLQNVNMKPTHDFTSTEDELKGLEIDCGSHDPLDWYECCSQHGSGIKSVRFPVDTHFNNDEIFVKDIFKQKDLKHRQDCECNMVPICHVKMLVNNIEDRLANSECTCDSLSSKVCLIHASKF